MTRLLGIINVVVPLCEAHRDLFEQELAKYGGVLDKRKRVIKQGCYRCWEFRRKKGTG